MVPATIVAALRGTCDQFDAIGELRARLPIGARRPFGTVPGSMTGRRFDDRSPIGDEPVTEERRDGEDVVGEAAGVGTLLEHPRPALVHAQSVQVVGDFMDRGRDDPGGEGAN